MTSETSKLYIHHNRPKQKKCLVCDSICNKIEKDRTNKDYCCLCLPAKHIDKPLKEWICKQCSDKMSREHYMRWKSSHYQPWSAFK